jgi:hypothetical protein
MSDIVLASINKNGRETVRVALSEFKGSRFVDLRTFATDASGAAVPTKAGVTLRFGMIRDVIAALEAAERQIGGRAGQGSVE